MAVKIEIDRSTPEFKKNNVVSKINSVYSAKVSSLQPLVIDILEREDIKYSRK
ncbi:MAG: hypothetical protein WCY27_01270 [archaeon]|jgi:hypothetical protein|nr:hypothetical protein [archaeon]MDD2477957.1 hypothetical protein [Candidatus ainarchaeum sp.]MDD3084951.1 hypothetical protein [Candidatus ainarchaeum sp.]MDD4221413.1 hypothetical protein [Candidatus ainarchaeum sp.]MDD4662947.1 hypothetical protein [Candidatus ainarchaeum sp.]